MLKESELKALCGRAGKALTGRGVTVELDGYAVKSAGVITLPVSGITGSDFLRTFLMRLTGDERLVNAWLSFAEHNAYKYSGDWLSTRLQALASFVRPRREIELEQWVREQERLRAEWLATLKVRK